MIVCVGEQPGHTVRWANEVVERAGLLGPGLLRAGPLHPLEFVVFVMRCCMGCTANMRVLRGMLRGMLGLGHPCGMGCLKRPGLLTARPLHLRDNWTARYCVWVLGSVSVGNLAIGRLAHGLFEKSGAAAPV